MEQADHVGVTDGNTLLLRKRGCRHGCLGPNYNIRKVKDKDEIFY
jgi:hypothetical protein